jgi:transcription antitermination factor NusA-like protein
MDEEQHVLIIGDSEELVNRAIDIISKLINSSTDENRNKHRDDQQFRNNRDSLTEQVINNSEPESFSQIHEDQEHLMTPYGFPPKDARIVTVPNTCVGLIIGKQGDMIRKLHKDSGCNIQVAKKAIPNSSNRYVFIEGPEHKYEIAKKLIEDIVASHSSSHIKTHMGDKNPFLGPHIVHKIDNSMVGLIIGKGGDTIKQISQKTGASIFIPRESISGEDIRRLEISGTEEAITACKTEIDNMIEMSAQNKFQASSNTMKINAPTSTAIGGSNAFNFNMYMQPQMQQYPYNMIIKSSSADNSYYSNSATLPVYDNYTSTQQSYGYPLEISGNNTQTQQPIADGSVKTTTSQQDQYSEELYKNMLNYYYSNNSQMTSVPNSSNTTSIADLYSNHIYMQYQQQYEQMMKSQMLIPGIQPQLTTIPSLTTSVNGDNSQANISSDIAESVSKANNNQNNSLENEKDKEESNI